VAATASRLKPLSPALSPEARALATFLRELLEDTGLSVAAYSKRHDLDLFQVRGFFQGEEIPGPDFVATLIADSSRNDRWQIGRELRIKAQKQRAAYEVKVEDLRQQLSDAQHKIDVAVRRELRLKVQLQRKEAELATLRERILAFERDQKNLLHGPLAIEGRKLDNQRNLVENEVDKLREELIHEKANKQEAERRLVEAEKQLENTTLVFANAGGADIIRTRERGLANYPSKPIDRLTVPLIRYGGPAYLGIVYGVFSGGWGTLRWLTVAGLVISLCFAYRIRRVSPTEYGTVPAVFIRALGATVGTFGIGYLLGHFAHFLHWS
jgi:hypothetical protein